MENWVWVALAWLAVVLLFGLWGFWNNPLDRREMKRDARRWKKARHELKESFRLAKKIRRKRKLAGRGGAD